MTTYKVQFNLTNGQSQLSFIMNHRNEMVIEFTELSEVVKLFKLTTPEQCSESEVENIELLKFIDGEVEEWEENEVPAELKEFHTGWIVKTA